MIRFDLLRFPLMVMVAYIHAKGTGVTIGDRALVAAETPQLYLDIQHVLTDELARVAVPLFYFISAYLFFRFTAFTFEAYRQKLATRLHTLVIPYVFWNGLLFAAIYAAQSFPATAGFFNAANTKVTAMTLLEQIDAILGVTRSPIAYQFWFIRDLIVLVVLSPLVYLLVRYAGLLACAVLFGLWATETWPLPIQSATPAFAFTLGAYFGIHRLDPFGVDRWGPAVVAVYGVLVGLSLVLRGTDWYLPVHYTGVVAGMAAAFYATKFAAESDRLRSLLLALAPASFFVFATHEPLITIAKKLIYRHAEVSPELVLAIYLIVPIAAVALTAAAYFLAVRVAPRLVRVATGGR